MRVLLSSLMLWTFLLIASQAHGQTTVIYQDDFESGVSGWSDNSADFAPAVSNFLGRFAAGQTTTSRTFTVPANSEELIVAFDLYRFDSWDNFQRFGFDRFEVEINGTQIFSLPFPNPQDARSGGVGNIEWSHTPLTGMEELGFNSGTFFFDQIHRFEIMVSNPGTSVTLTLRADLSQGGNDESAGYDNFLVTAGAARNELVAVAESFPAIDGTTGGVTGSVLASDTLNGFVLDPSEVTIISSSPSPSPSSPNLTLDLPTGLITVAANTAADIYTVDYQVCENIDLTNCDSVTETVTVFTPGGTSSFCPAGFAAVPGSFFVVSASVDPSTGGQPNNLNGAVGEPLPEGTTVTNENDSGTTFFQSLIYDLTGDPDIFVPEGTEVDVSFANHFNSNPTGNIAASLDGTNFTALGSSAPPFTNNTFRYDKFTIPSGGARFLQVGYGGGGGLRFDGVIYGTQCQPSATPVPAMLAANKTVAVFDPQNLGLYELPGNDVIYTISIENTGVGAVDAGSVFLVDNMPDQVIFFNGDVDDGGPETNSVAFEDSGTGLTFDFNSTVGFSNNGTAPTNFADCNYTPVVGYDPNVNFICFNPGGEMVGGSSFLISFRAKIK